MINGCVCVCVDGGFCPAYPDSVRFSLVFIIGLKPSPTGSKLNSKHQASTRFSSQNAKKGMQQLPGQEWKRKMDCEESSPIHRHGKQTNRQTNNWNETGRQNKQSKEEKSNREKK